MPLPPATPAFSTDGALHHPGDVHDIATPSHCITLITVDLALSSQQPQTGGRVSICGSKQHVCIHCISVKTSNPLPISDNIKASANLRGWRVVILQVWKRSILQSPTSWATHFLFFLVARLFAREHPALRNCYYRYNCQRHPFFERNVPYSD